MGWTSEHARRRVALMVTLMLLPAFDAKAQQTPATASEPAVSQVDQVDQVDLAMSLSEIYAQRARKIYGRHLEEQRFQVYADVVPKIQATQLPDYLADSLSPSALIAAPNWQLRSYVQSVRLEVFVDSRVPAGTRQKLAEMATRLLQLDPAAGDAISYQDLEIDLSRRDEESEKLAKELETLQTQSQALGRERNDFQRELQLTRAESERQAKRILELQQERDRKVATAEAGTREAQRALEEKRTNLFGGKPGEPLRLKMDNGDTGSQSWLLVASAILAAGLLAFGLLLIGRGFRAGGGVVGDALRSVATAMESGGKSQTARTEVQAVERTGSAGAQPAAGAMTLSQTNPDSVERRLTELRATLDRLLTGPSEVLALATVNDLLSRPETVEQGVATLEALNEATAFRLYQKLGSPTQAVVNDFMGRGTYGGTKLDILLAAAERLKMALLFKVSGADSDAFNERIMELAVRIPNDQLPGVIRRLPRGAVSRLLLCLDARRIADLLNRKHSFEPKAYDMLLQSLPLIPQARQSSEHDDAVIEALQAVLLPLEADHQLSYLQFYKQVVTETDARISEEVTTYLASVHPRIKSFLEEHVVTLATFFQMRPEIQEEILEYLSNKDLAALAAKVEERERQTLLQLAGGRRAELIEDEQRRLVGKGTRRVEQAFDEARTLIIQRIHAVRGPGSIQTLLKDDDTQDRSVSTAPQSLRGAA